MEYRWQSCMWSFSYNQAPFYQDGPRFWGTLLNGTGKLGTIGSSYANDRNIYGHKKYYSESFALVKYFLYNNRSIIVIFDDADHLYMGSDWHRTVWLDVAEKRSSVIHAWSIYDKDGAIVDHA